MTVTVVVGPPCSGKSTFVAEHAADGDVVVDFDKLAVALGSKTSHDAPYAIRRVTHAAREAAIDLILAGIDSDAWIIHTSPTPEWMSRYETAGAWSKLSTRESMCVWSGHARTTALIGLRTRSTAGTPAKNVEEG